MAQLNKDISEPRFKDVEYPPSEYQLRMQSFEDQYEKIERDTTVMFAVFFCFLIASPLLVLIITS